MAFTRRLQAVQLPQNTFAITSVTPGNNQITVTWDEYPGATGYRVARDGVDTTGGGPWTGDLAASARSWTALYLVNGNTYHLTVQPLPNGPVASVDAVAGEVVQISNFTATVVSNTQINLSWSYSGATLSNYTLRRGGTTIATPAAGTTSYNNTGLTAGTAYTYTLTGNYSAGGTTNTATVSRTTTGGALRKVMPLGDSITDGYNIPGGYRKRLWQRLVTQEGYSFDFVGSLSNGPTELGDKNHEGHSGWKIRDIRANIDSYINSAQPDLVLLMLGSNDMYANDDLPNAPGRLQELVQRINILRPGVTTILSTVTNRSDQQSKIPPFNAELPGVVQNLNNMGYNVVLVNAYAALTLSDLADGVHPNAGGYDKLADVWYPQLKAYLNGDL